MTAIAATAEAPVMSSAFRCMGCEAEIVVVGGPPSLVAEARARVDELEGRWSRFIESSDISRCNRAAGRSRAVSVETGLLVERAMEGRVLTGGHFDPTVVDALGAWGYDRTFRRVATNDTRRAPSRRAAGGGQVDLRRPFGRRARVRLAPGVGLDPGGVGKGLAADIVVNELIDRGADGACVNLGGDIRVAGRPPTDAGWQIAVEDPWDAEELARVALTDGAVVTSTIVHRAWRRGGVPAHHIIDPSTGAPATSGVVSATVLAPEAWRAEVVATAIIVAGVDAGRLLVDGLGRGHAALIVQADAMVVLVGDVATLDEIVWRAR